MSGSGPASRAVAAGMQEARRRLRMLARRDVRYRIGSTEAVLPPAHLLPRYQHQHPSYDRYFLGFARWYAQQHPAFALIDIGANVGDTALAVLSAAPRCQVFAVEGSPAFLTYLRRNTAHLPSVRIVEALVVPEKGDWAVSSDGSTGHLVAAGSGGATCALLTPLELLDLVRSAAHRIWKSDTDGFDIALLLSAFDEIVEACEIVWFEFDPALTAGAEHLVPALLGRIASLPRDVVAFDNRGNLMLHLPAVEAAEMLRQLTSWLALQRSGSVPGVHYLDVWLMPPEAACVLSATATDPGGSPAGR